MGVDVVNIFRRKSGALQRHLHGAEPAIAVFGRRGDVIGVAGKSIADNLAINFRAARFRSLIFFEHDKARPLAHEKAVAILVIGARCFFRRIIEMGGQRLTRRETGDADRTDRRFGAARQHDVSVIKRNQPRRIANRMSARRTGRDDGVVRAFQSKPDRHLPRHQIDEIAGDEEGRNPARALFFQHQDFILNAGKTANAGPGHHAGALALFFSLQFKP